MPDSKPKRFQERWFAVSNPSPGQTVLVIDASDVSDSEAVEMLRFAVDIVKEFGSILDRRCFFLGNSTPYLTDEFRQKSGEWRQANAGRLALIGPVIETLGANSDVGLLILAAGRIFDCEDWTESRLSTRTQIIGFGSHLQRASVGFGKEVLPDIGRLRECIDQRIS